MYTNPLHNFFHIAPITDCMFDWILQFIISRSRSIHRLTCIKRKTLTMHCQPNIPLKTCSISGNSPQGRLHRPLPAKLDQVTHHHKLICKSPQEPLPAGGIAPASEQKCSRAGSKSEISRLLQQTFRSNKT